MADFDPAMEGALTEAKALASKLCTTLDKLGPAITTFEQLLASMKLGVKLAVPLLPKHESQKKMLEFSRHGDQWRLLVVDGDTEVPLVNATRYERTAGIKQFKALVLTAPEVLEAEIKRVQEATEICEGFIEQVKAVMAKEG